MHDTSVTKALIKGDDSSGQDYVEVVCNKLGEHVRVTAIPKTYGADGAGPAIRIQIRAEGGKLRQGPEFASAYLPDVMWALAEMGRRLYEAGE